MLKAIHAQEDREAARVKVKMVTEKLKELKLEKAAALVEGGAEETFSYYDFPPLSFLKHVNGGLIFVNSPILKFVNGAQKPHLRCADSLPTIRFPAVYLPFLKNQWKITWISRSVCE